MKQPRGLSFDGLMVGLLFVALGFGACLVNAQSDTFWHLRAGAETLQEGRVPLVESWSHTAAGRPWPNHEWLWQVLSYAVFSVGGFPLLTALVAAIIVGGLIVNFRLLPGSSWARFGSLACQGTLSCIVWSVRPQAISLLAAALLLHFLLRRRLWPIPLLFLGWANFHGAVAMGGAVLLAVTVASLAVDRRFGVRLLPILLLSALATIVTPMGVGLWRYVLTSVGRSSDVGINEWLPPTVRNAEGAVFFALMASFLVLLVRRRGRLSGPTAQIFGVASVVTVPLAFLYVRNIPFALMTLAPLASVMLTSGGAREGMRVTVDHPRFNLALLSTAALTALTVVVVGWTSRWPRLGWRPMGDAAISALNRCPGNLYNRYGDGGFVLWFVPGKQVYIDSRQDPYPHDFVRAHIQEETQGLSALALATRDIRCAFLRTTSPTLPKLLAGGWKTLAADERFVVLEAPK